MQHGNCFCKYSGISFPAKICSHFARHLVCKAWNDGRLFVFYAHRVIKYKCFFKHFRMWRASQDDFFSHECSYLPTKACFLPHHGVSQLKPTKIRFFLLGGINWCLLQRESANSHQMNVNADLAVGKRLRPRKLCRQPIRWSWILRRFCRWWKDSSISPDSGKPGRNISPNGF